MSRAKRFLAAAIVAGFWTIGAGAAAALPMDKAPATTTSSVSSDVQQVRWHHRHWHHRYWHHRRWHHRHWHHRHWHHRIGAIATGTTGTGTIAVGATEPLGGIARSGACAHSGGSFQFGSTGLLGYAGVAL